MLVLVELDDGRLLCGVGRIGLQRHRRAQRRLGRSGVGCLLRDVRRPGLDVARLMSDCRDVAFSAGSACASGSGRSSHVLRALGLSEAEARSSIRLGWGRYTTEAELTQALDRIVAAATVQGLAA